MNFTQADMSMSRKRMAFDILSGKATEPLGREWRGLEIVIQQKREKQSGKKTPLLDKVCRPFPNTSKVRVVEEDLWWRCNASRKCLSFNDWQWSNEVDGTYYCRITCSGGAKLKLSSSCICKTSDDMQAIAMIGKLVEIVTDCNCYRHTLSDVMASLANISSYWRYTKERKARQYQCHHAYHVWPTHEFRRLGNCSVMGNHYFTMPTVTEIAAHNCRNF